MKHRRQIWLLVIASLSLLLAACGGNTPTPTPTPDPAPSNVTTNRSAAARGETLIISGENLGDSGSISLAGVPFAPDSWTSTEIELTVPASAPNGPQTVTITNAAGSATLDLFVGVSFPVGTLEELAALALPKGTAVLLGEGAYESTSTEVALDNLSLYGQGSNKTTLRTPDGMLHTLSLYADIGFDLVMEDLTMEVDVAAILPSPPSALGALSSSGAIEWAHLDMKNLDMKALALNALEAQQESLGIQAMSAGSYEMRNVVFEQNPLDGIFVTAVMAGLGSHPIIYGGRLLLENVTFTGENSTLGIIVAEQVELVASNIEAAGIMAYSLTDRIVVGDSQLTLVEGQLFGARGLEVTSSQFAIDGMLMMMGILPIEEIFLSLAGPSVVKDNSFTVAQSTGGIGVIFGPARSELSGNTIDSAGGVQIGAMGDASNLSLTNNTIRATHPVDASVSIAMVGVQSRLSVSGNDIASANELIFGMDGEDGRAAVTGNVITVGDESNLAASLDLQLTAGESLTFSANEVEFLSAGGLEVGGHDSVYVRDNAVKGFEGNATALTIARSNDGPLSVVATGNTFSDFKNALNIESPGVVEMLTVSVNDNVFDFDISATPQAAYLWGLTSANADLDATNNVWGSNTDASVVAGYIQHDGGSDVGILNVDPLTAP